MKKKYLITPEDVLHLKDTDTKIYCDNITTWYCQFMNGVLCRIYTNKTVMFNVCIDLTGNYYILVEEPVKEADENDIGKLCYFWDEENQLKQIEILKRFEPTLTQVRYTSNGGSAWKHCRRLTPEEVTELTGYKVEETIPALLQ